MHCLHKKYTHTHTHTHTPCTVATGHWSGVTQAFSARSTTFPEGQEHPLEHWSQETGKGSLQKDTHGAQAPSEAS